MASSGSDAGTFAGVSRPATAGSLAGAGTVTLARMPEISNHEVVAITGASRGIGRATARAFAATGASVALVARESPALAEIAAEIRDGGGIAVAVACDVTDDAAVEAAVGAIHEELGSIAVLVNNAGGGRYDDFVALDADDWEAMLSLNVAGLVNVTRAVLPSMKSRSSGLIINVGSVRGLEGAPRTAAYTASKFAVTGLTRTLQQELEGTGVLVSLVSPGGVKTGFGGIDPAHKDPTWMEPAAVADLIVQVAAFRGRGWISEVTFRPEPAG